MRPAFSNLLLYIAGKTPNPPVTGPSQSFLLGESSLGRWPNLEPLGHAGGGAPKP